VPTRYKDTAGGPVKPIVSLISLVLIAVLGVELSEIDAGLSHEEAKFLVEKLYIISHILCFSFTSTRHIP
jgi:hypothetical protein